MMDLMFKIPSDETIATCTITKDTVEGTGEPELTYREEVRGRRKHRISKIRKKRHKIQRQTLKHK